ncbi:hypothetical protein [Paractinoplanes maris]|uniref:hypothetical protein n=1 Tax=Paractinoplanes maris TaxID=1734446 RepID=UPI002020E0BA|nr:hypothetical protein [Actinoplanes maris]
MIAAADHHAERYPTVAGKKADAGRWREQAPRVGDRACAAVKVSYHWHYLTLVVPKDAEKTGPRSGPAF